MSGLQSEIDAIRDPALDRLKARPVLAAQPREGRSHRIRTSYFQPRATLAFWWGIVGMLLGRG
ncbi:hypothetical protein [Sphingobium baderi]|uniref:hypothetical protein n=1 Tax=Sphingobium baderi TaxID=1332080 RepID=UPI00040C65E1|nr:hypothetical protein [Sphingobium baderi]KMS64149.1 hypothetical protein V475_20425 [Sphingobium baderi LL03]